MLIRRSVVSLFLGTATLWLIRDEIAAFIMGGKTFAGRSLPVQIVLSILGIVLLSLLYLGLIYIFNSLFHKKIDLINKCMTGLAKEGAVKIAVFFENSRPKGAEFSAANRANHIRAMIHTAYEYIDNSIEIKRLVFQGYLSENIGVIGVLAAIMLAAYGFRLFSFSLTRDDQLYAYLSPQLMGQTLADGRWGMYLLSKYLLPDSIIPFVPMGLSLIFQLGGILLLLKSWKVTSRLDKIIIGAIGIAFPSLAYVFVITPLSYGIGAGFFCIGLSLFLYSQGVGAQKYLAAIPAALAFSIYQALIPALPLAFLIYLIRIGIEPGRKLVGHFIHISFVHILAIGIYYSVQLLLLPAEIIPASSHVSSYFDIGVLNNNLGSILASYWKTLFLVYSGDASIYSIRIDLLGALLVAALFGILISLARSRSSMTNKFLVLILTLMALLFPFASGLLMNGLYQMRFLLGVPIVVAGLTMLGLGENPRMYKLLLVFLATICIFQFTISTNRLFMSSYLTFQNDRLLASRLIERIEEAKIKASPNEKLTTLEVIGAFPVPPSSALIFRREYIGASFFNNYKNSQRAVLFLETLDYQGLRMAASLKRYQLLQIGSSMPIWPADGSVRLAGDTVLIKFGPYTEVQKQAICAVPEAKKISILNDAFCR